MSSQGVAAAVAVVGGLFLAVVLFVPVAAVHYRRDGRLTAGDLVALVSVTVYGLALWTYTLLPLPDPADIACRPALTDPLQFVDDIRANGTGSVADLLRNPAFLQVVLNVVLFVPLGALLRWRAHRGVVVAAGFGLATSLAIETTQVTGIWGIYECAYRYFDVDDLIANTLGAVAGSALAALVVRRLPAPEAGVVGLTVGRRVVAMVSDVLVMVILGSVAVVAWRAWLIEVRHVAVADIDPARQALVQWGLPLAVQAVLVLGRGRTVGEVVVEVRTRARAAAWEGPGRMVKLATGVGALAVLGAWDTPLAELGFLALAAAGLVAAFVTPDHRGLSNTLARLDVELTDPRAAPSGG